MKSGPALEDLVAVIIESCRAGLDPAALRASVLPRLHKAVQVDALWWATVDPATLPFKSMALVASVAHIGVAAISRSCFIRCSGDVACTELRTYDQQ